MKRLQLFISTVLTLGLVVGLSTPVFATNDHNPAGNNGFVKINNEEAPDNIPQNHPHVSCTFSVEFYNYDKNNSYANVTFELHPPTATDKHSLKVASGNLKPFIGNDGAGGGNDLDAREAYKLQFTGTPHAQQGYHVKLTVDAPGSKGSDKKHKVFWVQPCKETTPTTTPSNPNKPQVLGAETVTELPQTGLSLTGVLGVSGVVATLGYIGSYLRQKRAASRG